MHDVSLDILQLIIILSIYYATKKSKIFELEIKT